MSMIADRRLYLTKDKKRIVEEGDSAAGYLFAVPGQVISNADAEKYGLTVDYESESEPEPEPEPEAKMMKDVEDKMLSTTENKGKKRRKR